MNEAEIKNLVDAIVSDTQFWIALIGMAGVLIGATITVIGNLIIHHLREKKQSKLDAKRKRLLDTMLKDKRFEDRWRNLKTLSAVVGSSHDETMRLLIELGARGSEKADGKWGLLEFHPLDKIDQ